MKTGGINAVGYIRISTNEDKQKYGLRVQVQAIRDYCRENNLRLTKVYRDTKTGSTLRREGLEQLLSEKDGFDVLVILKLDRLSRSLLDLLKLLREGLDDKEVVFIQERIDQTTKEGRLLINQLASFAEYERELIIGRIKDGLAEARKRGVRLGAEPKYPKYEEPVREMRDSGMTWKSICSELKINYRTAKKCIQQGLH